jgi:signal transduction histidine kinase
MATAASIRPDRPTRTAGDLERVAHQLNNPLFAIIGVVELLLTEAEPGSETYEQLKLIERTGNDMREIVRSLVEDRPGVLS